MSNNIKSTLENMIPYVGIVCTSYGPIGSGVFLQSKKLEIVLITSRHVIIPAILGGWTTINYLEGQTFSFAPTSVRIDPDLDIGYLSLPEDKKTKNFFTTSSLTIEDQVELKNGDSVYFSGIPYCALSGLDSSKNSVETIIVLNGEANIHHIYDDVIECLLSDTVIHDLELKGITSLAGCSGGPVFSDQMKLVGILKSQSKNKEGKVQGLHFVPARHIPSLVDSDGKPNGELFNDYQMTEMGYRFHLNIRDSKSVQVLECELIFEHWYSAKNSNDKYGDFYRTRALVLGCGTVRENFGINVTTIAFRMDDLKSNSLNLWEEANRVLGYPRLNVHGYELVSLIFD